MDPPRSCNQGSRQTWLARTSATRHKDAANDMQERTKPDPGGAADTHGVRFGSSSDFGLENLLRFFDF